MARDVKNIFDNASRNIVRNFSNAYSITNEEENNEDYRIYSSKKDKTKKRSTRQKIADVLKEEGFIIDYKIEDNEKKQNLIITLKYNYGNPVINTIERVSKPGRRIFSSAESLPRINNGLGIAIISTPKGVMTDVNARKQKIGGEIICKVF